MEEKYTISKITETDFSAIRELALANGGNKNLTEDFLRHWYLNNPTQSCSMFKVQVDNHIEGYATTNNFRFWINGNDSLVAMPQNLLTSYKIRGKGLFGEIYHKTENDNISEKQINQFIVFSNKMSTPIFLSKFGYARANCPTVYFTAINPAYFFSKKQYERLDQTNLIDFNNIARYENSMIKTAAYYKWRYENYNPKLIHILAIKKDKKIISYAILKTIKKKGIYMLILMDVITPETAHFQHIIHTCRIYATQKGFAGLLFFELPQAIRTGLFSFKFMNRFNLLVKGKDADSTRLMASLKFNFFFGDLDIL